MNWDPSSFVNQATMYIMLLAERLYPKSALVIAQFRVQYDQYSPTQAWRRVNQKQNMNISHIVQGKRAVTSLSLTCKISALC